jgi:hypothetical protein
MFSSILPQNKKNDPSINNNTQNPSQDPQDPTTEPPIFIRQLPPYYPQKLHEYNILLARNIPKLAKAASFLEIPPLFLTTIVSLIIFVLLFAKFLVNSLIIFALLLSSTYNCLYMTAVLDEIIFSQVLNLTISLAFLAIYLLISPYIDLCLDWIPLYHTIKLFLAFSLTYHANSFGTNTVLGSDGTIITTQRDSNPFPLVNLSQNGTQNQQNSTQIPKTTTLNALTQVPALPRTAKASIDLIQALILLVRGYVLRSVRLQLWRVRTWAYNLKIQTQGTICDDDFDDFDVGVGKGVSGDKSGGQIDKNVDRTRKNNDQMDDIDEILDEYAIDDFNAVPDAQEVQ